MDHEQKRLLRMNAEMEGQEVTIANIGDKVTVSQMEIICLANFAEIGLMYLFSSLEGQSGEGAERSLEEHLERIRKLFGGNGRDGLNRLSQSAAAMLRGKFFQYIA